MKNFLIILGLLSTALFTSCSRASDTPEPSVKAGETRGFSNRMWYGQNAKDLDTLLTRRNFLIVLDGSGSMSESNRSSGGMTKIDAAKKAIKAFVEKLGPDDNVGLCAFDYGNPSQRTPLGFNNRGAFVRELENVQAGGGTPLSTAVELGYSLLQKQAGRQLGYGEYYLVIVTDGEANPGYSPTSIVNKIVSESPVVITTVGFDIGEGHSLNRPGLTVYHNATSVQELNEGLESVLAESSTFSSDASASFHK